MKRRWIVVACIALSAAPRIAQAGVLHDTAHGYRVDLPAGWRAVPSGAGHVLFASPNALEYVDVRPVLRSTSTCAAALRETLTGPRSVAAGIRDVQIAPAGRGAAMARFLAGNGAGRGATLCAETSPGVGMMYGAVVPAAAFAREWPRVMSVLRSFAYEPLPRRGPAAAPLPALVSWREPHERAFSMQVPAGWYVTGGIERQDVTHYTSGVQAVSPDRTSGVRIGDGRIGQCTVPGPGMAALPPAGGTMKFCGAASAAQVGSNYLRALLARDIGLGSMHVDATPRADLARRCEAIPASLGLHVRCSVVELRFNGTRGGTPVAGAVLVKTTLFDAVGGQNFILGTLSSEIESFWGPVDRFGSLARLTGVMQTSMRIDPVWWQQTQRINADVARRTLAQMHAEAESAQQASWDRMAAADRRSESVGYLLSGTTRLVDGRGNAYEAKAGSNYYFLGANGTVVRSNTWPSSSVDLEPLSVIR